MVLILNAVHQVLWATNMSLKTRPKCNLGIVITHQWTLILVIGFQIPISVPCWSIFTISLVSYTDKVSSIAKAWNIIIAMQCNSSHFFTLWYLYALLAFPYLSLLYIFSLLHSVYTPFLLLCQCMGAIRFADDRSFVQAITYPPSPPKKRRGSFVQARVLLILRKCQQCGSGDLQG